MAIQHAGGTIVNTTFTGDSRTAIADGVKNALVTAGWSVASGASGDWKLDSAVSPQSLQMRVRVWDPGSGNCAQIRIFNTAETIAPAQSVFLLPAASKTFRVVANRYQCFVFVPSSVTAREFAAFGLPYLPAHLDGVITTAAWLTGNAQNDTDTVARNTFRTELYTNSGNVSVICNASSWGITNSNVQGMLRLQYQGCPGFYADNLAQWHDDSYVLYDALIAWGLTTYTDASKIRGQLWGAFVDSADRVADTTFSFDDGGGSHDYIVITNSNTGAGRGTLCVAIT